MRIGQAHGEGGGRSLASYDLVAHEESFHDLGCCVWSDESGGMERRPLTLQHGRLAYATDWLLPRHLVSRIERAAQEEKMIVPGLQGSLFFVQQH